jgi:hypothetical protein
MNQVDEMKFLFESRPCEWIPVYECAKIGLQYNRIIDDMKKKYGMVIECRVRRIDGQTHSWKRYLPDGQGQLFDAGDFSNGYDSKIQTG